MYQPITINKKTGDIFPLTTIGFSEKESKTILSKFLDHTARHLAYVIYPTKNNISAYPVINTNTYPVAREGVFFA